MIYSFYPFKGKQTEPGRLSSSAESLSTLTLRQVMEAAQVLKKQYWPQFPDAEKQWKRTKMSRSDSLNELARQMELLGMDPKNYLISSKGEEKMRETGYSEAAAASSLGRTKDSATIGQPGTFFKQLDGVIESLNMLAEQVYHFHDRMVGAFPEPAETGKEPFISGTISHYENEFAKMHQTIGMIRKRLGQIEERL